MLKKILQSKLVRPHFPLVYHLEMLQYFRDANRHYDNMVRFHKLTEVPEDLPSRLFDYQRKHVWENQTFKSVYFRALTYGAQVITFINCAFIDCDFEVSPHLTIKFDSCKFDLERQGGFGSTHNRFNGNMGVYHFKKIRHAMLLCQRPPAKEAAFEMYFEDCSDFSMYALDYARIHLYLRVCDMRRLFVKDSNCLVTHSDSSLQSFLMLPPTAKDHLRKCTNLYQSINSVLFNGLLSNQHDDYYPLHLMRQMAKRYSYREELYEYNIHLKAGVFKEVLTPPKRNFNVFIMQMFDFFAYPLSLSVRSIGLILVYALLYGLIGIVDVIFMKSINYATLSGFGDWLGYFAKVLYLSVIAFTTAGFGDYVLPSGWELLLASESLVGVIYSSALLTSIFNRFHN